MTLEVRETFVNQTKGYTFGDEPWHDTGHSSRGALLAELKREYGRVASTMYRDPSSAIGGPTRSVGWVFEKRMRYEDARGNGPDNHYIREVWVEVREKRDSLLDDPRLRGHARTRARRQRLGPVLKVRER